MDLKTLMGQINKKYGQEVVTVGTERIYGDKVPFSSPRMNYLTFGGVPYGKSTELIGSEGSGKTTTALDIVANCQLKEMKEWHKRLNDLTSELDILVEKDNKTDKKKIEKLTEELELLQEKGYRKCVYVDCENTLDEEWATLLGVDTEELILVRPQDHTAEQVLQMIVDLCNTGDVACIVLDSVPMLVSQQIFEETLDKKMYGGIAGVVTEFSRRISPVISKNKVALVIINQIRENLNNPYDRWNTPGGKALKHLHALRLGFSKGSFIDEKNNELKNSCPEAAGNLVDCYVIKTKVSKPTRKQTYYTLKYLEGIDVISDTVDLAIQSPECKGKVVVQSGAWFYVLNENGDIKTLGDNELKFQGRGKLLIHLHQNSEVFDEIYARVNNLITDNE